MLFRSMKGCARTCRRRASGSSFDVVLAHAGTQFLGNSDTARHRPLKVDRLIVQIGSPRSRGRRDVLRCFQLIVTGPALRNVNTPITRSLGVRAHLGQHRFHVFVARVHLGVDIGKTIHPHPTLGESIGMAAEAYEGVCTDLPPPRKR